MTKILIYSKYSKMQRFLRFWCVNATASLPSRYSIYHDRSYRHLTLHRLWLFKIPKNWLKLKEVFGGMGPWWTVINSEKVIDGDGRWDLSWKVRMLMNGRERNQKERRRTETITILYKQDFKKIIILGISLGVTHESSICWISYTNPGGWVGSFKKIS